MKDESRIRRVGIEKGVFVDACNKNGESYIGIVRIENFIHVAKHIFKCRYQKNSHMSEVTAIVKAIRMYPEEKIYCDCDSAVLSVEDARVFWIPRNQNLAHYIARRVNEALPL